MTEAPAPPAEPDLPRFVAAEGAPPPGPVAAASVAVAPVAVAAAAPRWLVIGAALLAAVAAGAGMLAWNTQQRVKVLESELVRRQQDSGNAANEARVLARQAETASREVAAKMALLEARVAENAMQRSQFEDLIQSLARSRDENVLADVESAIRVALQQSAITGSAEPLVQVLRQADERLVRYSQPRLDRVRRAVVQDLERTRAAGVADIGALALRLDDAVRAVDELPLLSRPDRRAGAPGSTAGSATGSAASTAPAAAGSAPAWVQALGDSGAFIGQRIWDEVRSLVRVTRIDHPEAMLVAPEQAFFLRENLKLRLLNARLALLSRQFDTAQSDLRDAQSALDRYFDRNARRTQGVAEALRQVQAQARTVAVPRPDATLAAIATASAGR